MPPQVECLILTALPLEYNAVASLFKNLQRVIHPAGTHYDLGIVETATRQLRVALAECGQGNITAAIEAERAISFFQPNIGMFVGVAGGLKDVALGDVVFATKIYQYESGKASTEFFTRPQLFHSSYRLTQTARAVARNSRWHSTLHSAKEGKSPTAWIGPIAAGEKVIASVAATEFLFIRKAYNDAIAVEMEGLGFLQAGFTNALDCAVVRGISDLVEGKGDADASGSQPKAAAAAAAFAMALLNDLMGEVGALEIFPESWERLEQAAVLLYPEGPRTAEIWSRSGGDYSALPARDSGKSAWHAALRMLRQGGGGTTITYQNLSQQMLKDYPNNEILRSLSSR